MGLKWSQLFGRFIHKSDPELRVGMLGLDDAGKTTILFQLKLETDVQTVPTIGFNVETIRIGKQLLNIWDVSGAQPRARIIWKHYNRNTRAIIFVLDSNNVQRIPEAAEELRWLWWRPELVQAVFLIFANKQDLNGALPADQLIQLLDLEALPQQWAIQECCAINGIGLWEGLQELQKMLKKPNNKKRKIKYQK